MAEGPVDEDATSVRRALSGEDAAWTDLVNKYRIYLYRLARRVTMNEEDAMDAVQETLIKIAKNLCRFNSTGTFKSWITAIAIREAINSSRRESSRPRATDPHLLAELIDSDIQESATAYHPARAIDQARRLLLVHQASEQLSPQQRAILILGITSDIGPTEIAAHLGLPPSQVRNQWSRAVLKLREILQPDTSPMSGDK